MLRVEPVRDPEDRRKVVYWRFFRPGEQSPIGAVSHRDAGWRALAYGKDLPLGRTELGTYHTRREAIDAVHTYAAEPKETRP